VDPSGRFVYVGNLAGNNLTGYGIDSSTGTLSVLPGSPFATGHAPFFVAVANNSGLEFAYATNELDGTVSAFAVNSTTGALTPVAGSPFPTGAYPSSLGLGGAGTFAYVANFDDATLSGYAINPATGALTALAGSPFPTGFGPLWVSTPPALSVQIGGVSSAPGGNPSPLPPINSRSAGVIPVMINSGNSNDVNVDPSTLTFGATGTEKSLSFCTPQTSPKVCLFDTQKTGLQPGDKSVILQGNTTSGTSIYGSAPVVVR
jgi:DNA-binding beta-propeller fold protein YncE